MIWNDIRWKILCRSRRLDCRIMLALFYVLNLHIILNSFILIAFTLHWLNALAVYAIYIPTHLSFSQQEIFILDDDHCSVSFCSLMRRKLFSKTKEINGYSIFVSEYKGRKMESQAMWKDFLQVLFFLLKIACDRIVFVILYDFNGFRFLKGKKIHWKYAAYIHGPCKIKQKLNHINNDREFYYSIIKWLNFVFKLFYEIMCDFYVLAFYKHQTEWIWKSNDSIYTYVKEWPICNLHEIDCVWFFFQMHVADLIRKKKEKKKIDRFICINRYVNCMTFTPIWNFHCNFFFLFKLHSLKMCENSDDYIRNGSKYLDKWLTYLYQTDKNRSQDI